MASTTPNIGLTLPTGSENVSRQIINENNTKIDTAIGGTAGRELLGYKENGDTASQAIADGSFVVWKGNLYKANGSISQGTAFSGSNLTAVPSGGFNDLQGQVDSLSDSITTLQGNMLHSGIFELSNSTVGSSWSPQSRLVGSVQTLFGLDSDKIMSIMITDAAFNPAANGTAGIFNKNFYVASTQTTQLSGSAKFRIVWQD